MHKRTVIVPVQFAIAVECTYTGDGVLTETVSSFHPVGAGDQRDAADAADGRDEAWDACLEIPPRRKDDEADETWPDYQETVRQRLAMELGRPIWWEGDDEAREG